MKIILPLLGKTKEQYLAAGIDDFAGRLRRFVQFELPVLKEKKNAAKEDTADTSFWSAALRRGSQAGRPCSDRSAAQLGRSG